MLRLILCALVWLASSAPALAAGQWFEQGEALNYRVYWGPLSLGKASLSYTPGPKGAYTLEAKVKGSVIFFKMDDSWSARGVVKADTLVPLEYRAIQAENDYRANKRLTFNHAKRTMLYENLHDPSEPKQTVPLPKNAQDPFSSLYDLRHTGTPTQSVTKQVMGLKRPFILTIGAATTDKYNGKTLRKVEIVKTEADKPGSETWQIWLSNDDELVPVVIEAKLKAGSFRAVLDDPAARVAKEKEHDIP